MARRAVVSLLATQLLAFLVALVPAGTATALRSRGLRGFLRSRAAPASTYTTHQDACRDCMRNFPNEGAKRCHYGKCNLRDPNTQGLGGIIGVGAEWKPPQNRVCFSLDPVSWYSDCGSQVLKEAKNADEVSFACSYDSRLNVFSEQFHADFEAPVGTRLNAVAAQAENCETTIKEEGFKFYDDFDGFDSNHEKLSGCCATVHSFFTCLGSKKAVLKGDSEGLTKVDEATKSLVKQFNSFCIPLFQYPTKELFCKAFPKADPCAVRATGCEACVKGQGFWCPSSDQCLAKDWDGFNHCYQDCKERTKDAVKKKKRFVAKKKVVETVTPVADWYWKVVHGGVTDSLDYMPDPKQAITQGEPEIFTPGK